MSRIGTQNNSNCENVAQLAGFVSVARVVLKKQAAGIREVFAATTKGSSNMRITPIRRSGFTLVEIMIVVAIIGLLAAIAIPNFIKARTSSQRNACIANMKQMHGAKATWGMENKKAAADVPADADLFGADKYIAKKPECPAGGNYTLSALDSNPTCDKNGAPDLHILP